MKIHKYIMVGGSVARAKIHFSSACTPRKMRTKPAKINQRIQTIKYGNTGGENIPSKKEMNISELIVKTNIPKAIINFLLVLTRDAARHKGFKSSYGGEISFVSCNHLSNTIH